MGDAFGQKAFKWAVSFFIFASAGTTEAQFAPNLPKAPKELRPPKSEALINHLLGKGKQIYICMKTAAGFEWKLSGPDARLFGESGELAGRHYAGPTWQANDGSRTVGKIVKSVPSPDGNSIPWLLLASTSNDGKGIMARVQSIQRLNTRGGLAPQNGCDSSHETEEAVIPYEVDYYFYGLPRSGVLQDAPKF